MIQFSAEKRLETEMSDLKFMACKAAHACRELHDICLAFEGLYGSSTWRSYEKDHRTQFARLLQAVIDFRTTLSKEIEELEKKEKEAQMKK
jgi:hypothetical protein